MTTPPPLEREWVSLRDPDDVHVRYVFDVSFLLSDYACIYGRGCPGIGIEGADEVVGCCVHGAYLVDQDDVDQVESTFETHLDAERMQHHALAVAEGYLEYDTDDEIKTTTVDGACIFLNRDDGSGRRTGCVFHHLADDLGEHHMTYKPWVCWQVPLHRIIEEQVDNDGEPLEVHTITAFERGSWGTGGAEFAWWCTDEPDAFGHGTPLFASMERELRTMVGDAVYDGLRRHLDSRRSQRNVVRFLPVVS